MPEEVMQDHLGFYKFFVETELEDNDRLVFEWSIKQTYIALGNMMTAAAQIDIDSCPIEGFDKKQLTSILQNEGIIKNANDFGVSCMVAFGYRQTDPDKISMKLLSGAKLKISIRGHVLIIGWMSLSGGC
ncbi:nitroreductase family protein [Cytobacillus firmus]|uniref:Nitroreductase family protein n=2 Tax=Cytobacillus TaxID=2675230 RepID=A0A366JGQ5_CYTFI|nr:MULTISPECIES: nitroreductase family protein [Cytobacillus]RBP86169.1 nitroreductase family protein [Cytobacillus firmus]TDX36418.1 nitroreductase family protein [Cytobacillus oceanisediminis]